MQQEHVQNVKRYSIGYALIILCLVVTPFFAGEVAKLFDWCTFEWYKGDEGKLRPFFKELFTCIFWVAEFITLYCMNKRGKVKKTAPMYAMNDLEGELAIAQEKQTSVLPFRNVVFLFSITFVCILIISFQIDFQVKPFYDFGEKFNPISMWITIGVLLRNFFKCAWIAWLLRISFCFSENVTACRKKQNEWLSWIMTAGMVFAYGVYDVLSTANPFVWTYLSFYLAFTLVYYFTEKHGIKSFLLIAFIYLF